MLFDFFHLQIAETEIWIWAIKLGVVAVITIPLFLIGRAIMGPGRKEETFGPFDEPGDSNDFGNEVATVAKPEAPAEKVRSAEPPRRAFLDGTFLRKHGYYGNPLW